MIHIHTYEKWWIGLTIAMLVVFTTLIGLSAFANGFQVPEPWMRVDPRTIKDSGDFVEANLGLHELAPGKYEAYLLGQASPWRYYPSEMTVPVGAVVRFFVPRIFCSRVSTSWNVQGMNARKPFASAGF